jgi:hypothetical protein
MGLDHGEHVLICTNATNHDLVYIIQYKISSLVSVNKPFLPLPDTLVMRSLTHALASFYGSKIDDLLGSIIDAESILLVHVGDQSRQFLCLKDGLEILVNVLFIGGREYF